MSGRCAGCFMVGPLLADGRCADCTTMVEEPVPEDRQAKWDRRYIGLAFNVATWSKDPSTKVGAVLVRPNNSVASTGFNGFPPGHDDSPHLYADRAYKYANVIHAERNALRFLAGETAAGFTLYTSFPVCPDCMERAGKAGVVRVVYPTPQYVRGRDKPGIEDWTARAQEAKRVAERFGITVVEFQHV